MQTEYKQDRQGGKLNMVYAAIIRGKSKPGRAIVCTSMTELSNQTGIDEGIFRYQFGKCKRDYYEHNDPWVEIYVTDEVIKQSRPQYAINAKRMIGGY